ncbi:hypothetical protein H0H93_015331 [Arthromyces matolae]|nr:hypothetical protein H0H93_015331 [Arthromyces matolae]
MSFDFATLESPIFRILSAPHIDLATISAKNVRRQLIEEVPSLSPEFLRNNKREVDAVIRRVFETVNAEYARASNGGEEDLPERSDSRKRKQDPDDEEIDGDQAGASLVPKKSKKSSKNELSDAEIARQLSNELNRSSRRTSAKPSKGRGSANGAAKRGGRTKKSSETVESEDDSGDNDGVKKPKKRSSGGGAKGGFAKEFILSEPLAAVLQIEKLSRPQVVKQLWVYIKEHELQNPDNRREIMCDPGLRGIFGVDKIDMFKMNKVLGQHLHEVEA